MGSEIQARGCSAGRLLATGDADGAVETGGRLASIDRKLEQIAVSLGVRGVSSEGDDEEDRKRLKEKLKQAIEADRRSRVRTIVSRGEVRLEPSGFIVLCNSEFNIV